MNVLSYSHMTLTPEQFNILATKDDVKKEVRESEERIKQEIHKVLEVLDGFAKKIDTVEIEQTSNIAAHDRFEKRISHVETRLNLKPAV